MRSINRVAIPFTVLLLMAASAEAQRGRATPARAANRDTTLASAGAEAAPRAVVTHDSTTRRDAQGSAAQKPGARPWYEKISLRGYTQVRYNRLLETNEGLSCAQCDRSIGNNGGFLLRRGRLVFSGDLHPRVSFYIQPDFGAEAAGGQNYLQIRDAYFDVNLDARKAHRLRIGQSKVPYGFENLQSSSNRLPLDRNDALNSAMPNERDIGVFYYYAGAEARKRFRILTDSGLKGSGDYGVLGVGVMNGQTANRAEANNSLHAVARLTYPWRLPSGQFVETSVQAYRGRFVVPSKSSGVAARPEYDDERIAATLVWYAQPFGVVAEYNWGRGPEFVAATHAIEDRRLQGGFVQSMYRWQGHGQVIQPFARLHSYHGGKKIEQDAKHYEVHEFEAGIEWLPFSALELTAQYTVSDRVFEDNATIGNRQQGRFLRLQAQFNY